MSNIDDIKENDKKVMLARVKTIMKNTTDDAIKKTAKDIIAGNINNIETIIHFIMTNHVVRKPKNI